MSYAAPESLADAVALLGSTASARVLAGGHRLLVEPQRRSIGSYLLVDLRRIPSLAGITASSDGLTIGAMTTLRDVARDERVRASFGVLATVIESIGDVQLRNRATLGGSLAGADATDPIRPVISVLGGTVTVTGRGGSRVVAADDLLTGTASLAADDIITAVTLPTPPAGTGAAYEAVRNPASQAPIAAVAASVVAGGSGIASGSVVLIGVTSRPVHLTAVESRLATDGIGAAAAAGDGLEAITDLFASADYRVHLARVLTERALSAALASAKG